LGRRELLLRPRPSQPGSPLPGSRPFDILFLSTGLGWLSDGCVVIKEDEESLHSADEGISGHSVCRAEFLHRHVSVLADCLDEGEGHKSAVTLIANVELRSALICSNIGPSLWVALPVPLRENLKLITKG
jgi:hypothetical protein